MEKLATAVRPTFEDAKHWTDDEWQQHHGFSIEVPCRHSGCRMRKHISCYSPTQFKYGLRIAGQEKWYCHHHKLMAWENSREISTDLLPYLKFINDTPGANKAKLRCKQRDLNFLLAIGLISVDAVPRGTKIGYEIELTDQGEQYLDDRVRDLANYMANQPTRAQLEWYVP
jgi:hypothetical protein